MIGKIEQIKISQEFLEILDQDEKNLQDTIINNGFLVY